MKTIRVQVDQPFETAQIINLISSRIGAEIRAEVEYTLVVTCKDEAAANDIITAAILTQRSGIIKANNEHKPLSNPEST